MSNRVNSRWNTAASMMLASLALSTSVAAQQAYPAKQPIRIVVAAGPGGFADAVARLVSEKLSVRLGQTTIIENRGGAGGNIAARAAA